MGVFMCKKQFIAAIVIAAAAAIFISCTGPKGSTGPAGANAFSITFQNGLSPSASYVGIVDTYIDSANATTKNYANNLYYVGYIASTSDSNREIIRADLTQLIPSNATVVKAYLTFTEAAGSGATFPVMKAYRLNQAWIQQFATWNLTGGGPWTPAGGGYDTSPVSDAVSFQNGNAELTFTLDNNMVQSWLADPASNYGVIIIDQGENVLDGLEYFYTSQAAVDYDRPKFTVYYTVQ
jgi:hypothetical protein